MTSPAQLAQWKLRLAKVAEERNADSVTRRNVTQTVTPIQTAKSSAERQREYRQRKAKGDARG